MNYWTHVWFFTVPQWNRYPEEITPSVFNANRFDTPREGAEWLTHFKYMNEDLIKSLDVRNLQIPSSDIPVNAKLQ